MASMTSVISLFVLLLVTYSYAKPVEQRYNASTPEYQFSTNGTTFQNASSFYMGSMAYETTTDASNIHQQRSFIDLNDEETTTSGDVTVSARSVGELESEETTTSGDVTVSSRSVGDLESEETTTSDDVTVSSRSVGESNSEEITTSGDVTVSSRSVGESNSEESTTPVDVTVSSRSVDISPFSSSTPSEEEQNFTEFTSTPMESSTAFNQRAISNYGDEEEFTSSTPFYRQGQQEINRNVQPSSSVTKFGQNSGFFSNGQTVTPGYEKLSQTNGQSGSQFLTQGQKFSQPIGINQVPVGQVYQQQPASQFSNQGQRFPQSVEIYQVPVSQVSGQQSGSQYLTQGQRVSQPVVTSQVPIVQVYKQQSGSQVSNQGQRFPQSIGMTQGQGSQVNVVPTTSSQQLVTDEDMDTHDVGTYPTTTIRGFTGRQTNVPRRF